MAASHYFHCLRVCKLVDELGSLVPGISEFVQSTCWIKKMNKIHLSLPIKASNKNSVHHCTEMDPIVALIP
jgi:hypothetical protein